LAHHLWTSLYSVAVAYDKKFEDIAQGCTHEQIFSVVMCSFKSSEYKQIPSNMNFLSSLRLGLRTAESLIKTIDGFSLLYRISFVCISMAVDPTLKARKENVLAF